MKTRIFGPIALLAIMTGLFGLILVAQPESVDAAICYTETSNSQLQPTTHTCPAPSSSVTYPSGVSNPTSLPDTRCFVSSSASGPSGTRIYREESCSTLENLRNERTRQLCEAEGGEIVSNGLTGTVCQCPGGESWNGSSCIRQGSTTDFTQPGIESDCSDPGGLNSGNCGIIRYLVLFINVLSALVGLVVIASIIIGGIQYTASGSDPQKVAAAKDRIRNAIIALIFFIFTYSFLNYLVPGGVLL
ncbi:MAG: pilin [bacterium]|nr:pilin [bacterium]